MTASSPSILYLGMPSGGELSRQPLAALLDSGSHVCAVLVPGQAGQPDPQPLTPVVSTHEALPVLNPYLSPNLLTLAWERGLPVLAVGSFTRALENLAALEPGLICVSCFSRIIPPALLNLPPHGAINLHPSLLPRYRGPAPLFWQFKNGETHGGVTVHFMNERLDAGDILLQEPVPFPDGMTAGEALHALAQAGSGLVVRALDLIRRGDPPRTPQPEPQSTYYPVPSRADYELTARGSARRAFNFIRGAGDGPFEIRAGGEIFRVKEAIEYAARAALDAPFHREGDQAWIQFEPGVLRVRIS
jgi:methionyl-tRNA formyltransferase